MRVPILMAILISVKSFLKTWLDLLWSRKKYKFAIKEWTTLRDLKACSEVLGTMRFSRNLRPVVVDCPNVKRILTIAPHPDDEILGAGGTLIKAIRNNTEVRVLYLTSGKEVESSNLEKETIAVANKVGYDTLFLRFDNNNISLDKSNLRRVGEEIDRFKPECLFMPSLFDDHDDHRRASHILLQAYRSSLITVDVTVWTYQVYSSLIPNVVVDITKEVPLKDEVLRMWKTQSAHRDWAHYILGLNAFNVRWLRTREPRFAEAFFVVPLSEYIQFCEIYFDRELEGIYYLENYIGSQSDG